MSLGSRKSSMKRPSFQKQKKHAPSAASAHTPIKKGKYNAQNLQNNKARPAQSQGSKAQGGS